MVILQSFKNSSDRICEIIKHVSRECNNSVNPSGKWRLVFRFSELAFVERTIRRGILYLVSVARIFEIPGKTSINYDRFFRPKSSIVRVAIFVPRGRSRY